MSPLRILKLVCCFILGGFFILNANVKIGKVSVEGNSLSSDRIILKNIKSRSNSFYNQRILNEDIKRLYELGRFKKIEVKEAFQDRELVNLIFIVIEKPIISERVMRGNTKLKEKKFDEELLSLVGTRYDKARAIADENKIIAKYKEEGYLFVVVDHEIEQITDQESSVRLVYNIAESASVKIGGINIKGNSHVDGSFLKKVIKTKVDRFLGKGSYDPDIFKADLENIELFYKTEGFLDAEVRPGKSYFSEDRNWLYLNIEIDEGRLYVIDNISIVGNSIVSNKTIREKMTVQIGMPYSEKVKWQIEKDIEDHYGELGRVFSRVRASSTIDERNAHVDISISIDEQPELFIEEIDVKGNTRTQDVVIRRELMFYPTEKFNTKLIKDSKRNLNNLGFFEKVDINIVPGSRPELAKAEVIVSEKQTGSINFALGFSSVETIFGQIKYVQRNFDWRDSSHGVKGLFTGEGYLGDGQYLEVAINNGTESRKFTLDFSEPWVFNRKIRFGFGLFHTESEIADDFDERRDGFYLRVGKEFFKDFEGYLTYNYSQVEISDIVSVVSPGILEQLGKNKVGTLKNDWIYDTRDNRFFTTSGMYFKSSLSAASKAFAGDQEFFKGEFELKNFYKAFVFGAGKNIHMLSSRVRVGYAREFGETTSVPIFERFFAGGLGSVRGFENRSLGPYEIASGERFEVGGNFLTLFNLEYNIPISEETFRAVIFYDQGNVFSSPSEFETSDLRSSIGAGIRVRIPALGPFPISLDFASAIKKKDGDKTESFSFNFGNFF